jgi:hypothetical protein
VGGIGRSPPRATFGDSMVGAVRKDARSYLLKTTPGPQYGLSIPCWECKSEPVSSPAADHQSKGAWTCP